MLLALLAACGRQGGAPVEADAAPPQLAAAQGIDWIEGDVEAAFVQAQAQGKLVFLYWGAQWCPPCHDLTAHVFSRPDFQEKIRQFVPVHLDGDAPGAQRLGNEFKVLGYPTAVVLRADRTEVARIAGGMDLTRYADVLDLALEGVRPLPDVFAGLRSAAGTLDATDCRRLAYNGWALDPLAADQPDSLVESLVLAAARCPATAVGERDRLLVTAAGIAAGAGRPDIEKGEAASAQLLTAIDAVDALLASPRGPDNADVLLALDEDFFAVLRALRPARVAVVQANWFALMDAIENEPRYADPERLMSAAGRLTAAKALAADGAIPPPVAQRARATLDAFLARDYTADARAGVINSASWVLSLLGDDARLRALLEAELRGSRTPYYYMPDIAALDEKAGRHAEALQWLERGYKESTGPATRFQWGVLYVEGLLRMAPEDHARVRDAALAVIGELDGPDRIHARTGRRLDRLGKALQDWATGPARAATMRTLQSRWLEICARVPDNDPAHAGCPALLRASGA